MRVTRRQFAAAAASLMMLGPVGCSSVSKKDDSKKPSLLDRMPWASDKDEAAEPYPNPVKLAATWTPDTLVQMGRTPTRGFGGRIFFYDEKSRPVPVSGTLNVHGFDEKAKTPADAVKKFEFTPEQFTQHFSQTDLGASYSVWIPWDAVGSNRSSVTLVASFKTDLGKVVQGVPTTVVLPGPIDPAEQELANKSEQYRAYEKAMSSNQSPTSGLTTTTIRRKTPTLPTTVTEPKLPIGQQGGSMFAGKTRSVEIPMSRRKMNPGVMPASAQVPVNR